jgi:gliding motility-associated-like protein
MIFYNYIRYNGIFKVRRINLIILSVILSVSGTELLSQKNCTVPESPVLQNVSVIPESGNVTLKWNLSPSSGIAGYIIYTFNNGVGIPVDTIWNPSADSYLHVTTGTRYFSLAYVVAAHRMPNCTSPLSNDLNTIFAKADIDTCKNKITISWNSYPSVPEAVSSYSVFASKDGGEYFKIADTPESQLNFEYNGFATDASYEFIVKAGKQNGDSSLSNKAYVVTKMQKPPEWINADYATVAENRISLSFSADPSSELLSYRLDRKTGRTGSFTEISRINSVNGKISYTDPAADIKSINYYRLSSINACNNVVTVSNVAANIVLQLERTGNNILLKWNKYENRNGNVESYKVYANTGNGFSEVSDVSYLDTTKIIDYKSIMYDITSGEACFYVSADEINNPYGINSSSKSQTVCTNTEEVITIPDVFTPNNDLVNDLFRPVLSFSPSEYIFRISNRAGKMVFETKDYNESWDGTDHGGKVMQDVYLWFLKLKTPSGKIISKTGTVTVYFNK